MKNMIRRSDAIKAFCMDCKGQSEPCEHSGTCKTLKVLRNRKKIPAAEPKQGEWIFKTVFPNDKSEFPMGYLVCSVCGSHHSNSVPCNYCDNCGCRMKGSDDE